MDELPEYTVSLNALQWGFLIGTAWRSEEPDDDKDRRKFINDILASVHEQLYEQFNQPKEA
jgi:hypothetical protein